MDAQDYAESALLNLQSHDYEPVEAESELFEAVRHKTKTVSYLDSGRERRFVGVAVVDDLDVATVREGFDELDAIAEENVRVGSVTVGKGGLATTPLIAAFVSSDVDDDVVSAVEDMDTVEQSDMRIPVVVDVDGGGLMSSGPSLSYPLPRRRYMPRRRAVKKLVSAAFEDV